MYNRRAADTDGLHKKCAEVAAKFMSYGVNLQVLTDLRHMLFKGVTEVHREMGEIHREITCWPGNPLFIDLGPGILQRNSTIEDEL